MLYILSGQDDFSLTQSLEEIKKESGESLILAVSTTTLDGQQVTLDQLKIACETAPFLMGRRLVIIRGLLERFDVSGKSSHRAKVRNSRSTNGTIRQSPASSSPEGKTSSLAESKSLEEYKLFGSCLTRIPDTTILVLIENKIAGNNPLFKTLAGKAVVKSFLSLRGAKLTQWVQQRVKEEGGTISPQAVDSLVRFVGSNLWIMGSEINKLVLFAAGRRIEEEDVKIVTSSAQQMSVFTMVDAIVEFKTKLATQLLEQLVQRGAAPAYLLTMLTRQVRLIFRARELTNQGESQTEIQSKLGLSAEFALRKTLEQAKRYSLPRLKEVYHHLLEADLSIKNGKYDGELALNILVVELCQPGKIAVAH
ncbi:MAG: DNA polymerase III subunit delta [Chloroflexi bacterium]|nr:DNA polymerase III subunit delta [Chloroflexota bacterium]